MMTRGDHERRSLPRATSHHIGTEIKASRTSCPTYCYKVRKNMNVYKRHVLAFESMHASIRDIIHPIRSPYTQVNARRMP